MDQLPARLRTAAGDEPVIESVDLGGGDALVVTPPATHLYRAEGLLSDESVTSYRHAVDRFAVQESRRKHTMVLDSIEGEERFTVPARAADAVVEAVLEGILRSIGVLDPDESVLALFRFSDLTLVVTDTKLFKHVGPSVWNEDYEMFDYDSLTDLAFEEGKVATQVVLELQGRQQRVKVPNERAGNVRRAIQNAVFEFHGVSSLDALRAAIGEDEDETTDDGETAASVTDPPVEAGTDRDDAATDWSPPADQDVTGPRASGSTEEPDAADAADQLDGIDSIGLDTPGDEADADGGDTEAGGGSDPPSDAVDGLRTRVEDLETQLERQNELLEQQTEALEQLVDELRRGR